MRQHFIASQYVDVGGITKSRWLTVSSCVRDIERMAEHVENYPRESVPPDELVFIYLDDLSRAKSYIAGSAHFITLIQRFGKTRFFICGVDRNGNPADTSLLSLGDKAEFILFFSDCPEGLDLRAVAMALDPRPCVIEAPHGYCFKKTSGTYSSHFLRADRAFVDSDAVEICALSVLAKLGAESRSDVFFKRIYIDTSGVFSVAYALRALLQRGVSELAEVINYRGYDGLAWLERQPLDDSLIIVSASSSANMQVRIAELCRNKGARASVLALVGFSDGACDPIVSVDRPRGFWSGDAVVDGTRVIDLVGESFFPVLDWKTQAISFQDRHWQNVWGLGPLYEVVRPIVDIPCVSLRRPDRNYKLRDVFINAEEITTSTEIADWFDKNVVRCMPHDTSTIVYFDGDGSEVLAKRASVAVSGWPAKTVEAKRLASLGQIKGSVLVVSGVSGRGTALNAVSRQLRDQQPLGHRVYAPIFILPERMEHALSLKQNLKKAPADVPSFGFCNFRTIPIGKSALDWWDGEVAVLERLLDLDSVSDVSEAFARKRLATLSRAAGQGPEYFVDIDGSALSLSQEFAPWKGSAHCGPQFQPQVLLTIKAILQHSREGAELSGSLRLLNSALVRGIIGPANFVRFSDGLIQASILAAAEKAELDYSGTVEASESFVKILSDMLITGGVSRGEGLYSILLAIVSGKMRLSSGGYAALRQLDSSVKCRVSRDILRLIVAAT